MNLIKTFVTVAVVAGLTVGGYIAGNNSKVVEVKPVEVRTQVQSLGALTSPDIPSPYISVGAVQEWYAKQPSLTQATTTVCALESPSGTSTLQSFTIKLDVSSTTASRVTLAKAATPYATTTILAEAAVSANAKSTLTATSTTMTELVFGPNQYAVVGMAGGIGTFSPTGVCSAHWTSAE
jgi:hypothetical protein